MKGSLALIAAVCGVTAFSTAAEAKAARCELVIDGEGSYSGPCNFALMEHGSFEISAVDKRRNLIGELESIAVWVGASSNNMPNKAFYSYTRKNDVSRNGAELTRQKNKPACWVGQYDKICVY